MADNVSIATRFYEDGYIQSLPPTDKLLFKYLLDGPSAEPTLGIYEISLRTIAFHTGLDVENIEHSMSRFAETDKIHYLDGWVILKNHFKHNPLHPGSAPGLLKGAKRRLDKVPWHIRERLLDPTDTLYIPYLNPTDTLFIGYPVEPGAYPTGRVAVSSLHSTAPHVSSRHVSSLHNTGASEASPSPEGLKNLERQKRKLADGRRMP